MITVADVSGSAPREAGTRMIVTAEAQWGTIGGGNLEFQALKQARELLEHQDSDYRVADFPLGPELGQCCGGYVRLLIHRLTTADRVWVESLKSQTDAGQTVILETTLEDRLSLRHEITKASAADSGTPTVSSIGPPGVAHDEAAAPRTFRQRLSPPTAQIVLFGAGHVGQAVARALAPLPVCVTWIDSRADYLPTKAADNTKLVLTPDLAGQVAKAPAGSLFLVFTHSHDLDYQVVHAVLRREDFRYCGLIGSRTKRASFERRLRDAGISQPTLSRLVCPIGMAGLKSKDPSVIAVGVVAELLTYIEADQKGAEGAVDHGH